VVRYLSALAPGAVAGAGAADESSDIPEAAAVGAPMAAGGTSVGELLGDIAGEGARRIGQSQLFTGIVQPNHAAQYLEQQGVNNLTIGQMTPGSRLAQLEEAASFSGGSGPAIQAMRQAGREEWQRAAANATLPPGMAPVPAGTVPTAAQHALAAGFDDAYAVAHGHTINPDTLGAVAHVLDSPNIRASDQARADVAQFLQNQFSALRMNEHGGVDSGDVIALRSALRDEARDLANATDGPSRQERALFQAAIERITAVLDAELPPGVGQALRETDAQYAQYMTLGNAVAASKDMPNGFTPAQLQNAVATSTPRAIYKQGGGGPLRGLSAAGRETLDMRSPPTGAIAMVTGSNPVVPWVNGFMMQTLNRPGPRAALLGRTALQQSVVQAAHRAGEVLGPSIGRLGAAAAYAQRNEAEAPVRRDTSTSDVVSGLVSSNPEALGPYAQQLQQAEADGTLPLVHYTLQQTDPNYRRMLDAVRSGGTQ
jgi:hypothetical protein